MRDGQRGSGTSRHGALPALVFDAEMQQIRDALRGLRYGVVNIVVQDGVIA